jgi:hypothetical protein
MAALEGMVDQYLGLAAALRGVVAAQLVVTSLVVVFVALQEV